MLVNRSRRSRKSDIATTPTRSAPFDLTRPENKTVSQLKDELDSKGIDYRRYSKKSQLIALWKRSENFQLHGPKQKVLSFSISDDEDDTEMPKLSTKRNFSSIWLSFALFMLWAGDHVYFGLTASTEGYHIKISNLL